MDNMKLVALEAKEGTASLRLSSGEVVSIYLNVWMDQGLVVRVAKRGFIGLLPGKYIWRFLLTNKTENHAINGNIVYFDFGRFDPLQSMIGYIGQFPTIDAMKKVTNNHVAYFDPVKARAKILELGIVKPKNS